MMMKCMLLTLFLFLGVYSAKSASTNEEHENNVDGNDGLREFFKRKCLKNANIKSLEELEREIRDTPLCRDSFNRPEERNEFYDDVCLTSKNYECLVQIQEKIQPCFDAEEKYLKNFLLGTHNASVGYFCKDSKEAFEETVGNFLVSIVSCSEWQELVEFDTDASCLRDINLEFENNSDLVVTKSWLCSKLEKATDCLFDGFKKRCEDDIVPNFTRGGMKLLLNWCIENDVLQEK